MRLGKRAMRWAPFVVLRALPSIFVISSALAKADSQRWAALNIFASFLAAGVLLGGPKLEKWLIRWRLHELPSIQRVVLSDCITRDDYECIRRTIAILQLDKDHEDHLLHWIQRNPAKAKKFLRAPSALS
jgi:hypothetical protein